MSDSGKTLDRLIERFPGFARARKSRWQPFERVLPGRTAAELAAKETTLGIELPASYKTLLSITGGFWLADGEIQINSGHPFFHEFPGLDELTDAKRRSVIEGEPWPPPSNGMLCFAEMFMLADGDQALFDVSGGMHGGEYPVYYYAHDSSPAAVHLVASGFEEFMNEVLNYPEWG